MLVLLQLNVLFSNEIKKILINECFGDIIKQTFQNPFKLYSDSRSSKTDFENFEIHKTLQNESDLMSRSVSNTITQQAWVPVHLIHGKKIMIEANLKAMRQQKKNANSLSRRASSSIFKIFVISIHWWWRKKFCLWLATNAESTRQHKARTFLPHSFLFQLDETVAIHLRT